MAVVVLIVVMMSNPNRPVQEEDQPAVTLERQPSQAYTPPSSPAGESTQRQVQRTDTSSSELSRLGIRMVSIPGGSFQLGSNDGYDDEKPVHTVTVSGFEMSATEVTVGQFREFVNETGYRTEAERGGGAYVLSGTTYEKKADANWKRPYFTQTDAHPVVCVSWNDAVKYCEWLSGKTGTVFRLPTEAEWEYACRAGTGTRYYTGDNENDLGRAGWYNGNSGKTTHPVGQKEANRWGLYDMHGNVWEWCNDWYGSYPSGSQTNPTGPSSGS
jgi:formylglycine-generating enzyme required for sulfatase activity